MEREESSLSNVIEDNFVFNGWVKPSWKNDLTKHTYNIYTIAEIIIKCIVW